jgi:hypothetical protein
MNFKHFVLIGGAGLFGLVVLLVLNNLSNRGTGRGRDFEFRGDTVPVSADNLLSAFKFKKEEAATRFADKGVEVSGVVMAVDKALILNEDLGVMCFFPDKEWSKVEKEVKEGDMVRVRGLCTGLDPRRSAPTVIVTGCSLVADPKPFEHP